MNDRVSISLGDDGVADVRLNRPDKMNALDGAMFEGLLAAAETLRSTSGLRAVVLSGEGRAFCAGLDFGGFMSMAGANDSGSDDVARIGAVDGDRITHRAQEVAWQWHELEVPVIAAIHGVALGGGCQIALGADIRYIAPDAQMSILEVRWGLCPDMTISQTIIRHVGLDVAKELYWTGRMVDGEEAVQMGLATHVADDPHAAALELAREIASKSPHAVRADKRILNAAHHATVAEGFAHERDEIGRLIGSPNQSEAVTAYFEKRAPVFSDPE